MKRFTILAAAVFALMPVLAIAADDHGPSVSGFFWRVLVFAVFVGLMIYLLKDRVKNGLGAGVAAVKQSIADAEKACADSEAELADYTRKMLEMSNELEAMKANARNTAEKEVEKMLEDGEKAVEKMKASAKQNIETETARASDLLKRETVLAAIDAAEKKLASSGSDASRKQFIKDNITKIGA